MDIKETTKIAESHKHYSRDTIRNAVMYIKDKYRVGIYVGNFSKLCESIEASENDKNAPKPAKLVAKEFLTYHGIHLTADDKAVIGKMFADSIRKSSYKVSLTLGCDGSAKDYYHADSCWWGGYSDSREYVAYNGGGAIRAYDPETNKLCGRVWFLPADDGIVIFNSYGVNELQHTESWATIASELLSAPYCKCTLHLQHDQYFFLNAGVYIYVGPKVEPDKRITITLEEFDERIYDDSVYAYCSDCDCEIRNEDDAYYTVNGTVCESCFDSYVCVESEGGDYYPEDDCVYLLHGRYSEWFLTDSSDVVSTINGAYELVENCIEDVYGNYYQMDDDIDDVFLCDATEEYYPISELLTLADGRHIAESNYDRDEYGPLEGEEPEEDDDEPEIAPVVLPLLSVGYFGYIHFQLPNLVY
jgi:hypothetical protein